jgi:hypothetical protein
MELSRKRRARNSLNSKERKCGQGQNRTADTRIFSPVTVRGLCVTTGLHLNESKRLEQIPGRSIYRFIRIRADGSGKVVAK